MNKKALVVIKDGCVSVIAESGIDFAILNFDRDDDIFLRLNRFIQVIYL